jgi:hypothetical protein
VLSFQHYGNIAGTLGARLCGARVIIANQSGAPQKRGLRGLLTGIDRLMGTAGLYQLNVVNSGWTQAQFDAFPLSYRKRLRRIDHGVPAPAEIFDKTQARAAFGLPAEAMIVLSSGRLSPSKNQVALVGALALTKNVHLAIAGTGPEHDALVALAGDLQVRDRLHLVGEVSPARIYEFLAAGDAYAFSSLTETFGLAAVEAAIAGLPVVASDLDVLREVLTTRGGEAAAFVRSAGCGWDRRGALGNPRQAGACQEPCGGREKASGAICARSDVRRLRGAAHSGSFRHGCNAVDHLQRSGAVKRVNARIGPVAPGKDGLRIAEADGRAIERQQFRQSEPAAIAERAVLKRKEDAAGGVPMESAARPRPATVDQDGVERMRAPGSEQCPRLENCERIGGAAKTVAAGGEKP